MFLRASEHNMQDGGREGRKEWRRASSSCLNTWMWMERSATPLSGRWDGQRGRSSDLFTPTPLRRVVLCCEIGTCDLQEGWGVRKNGMRAKRRESDERKPRISVLRRCDGATLPLSLRSSFPTAVNMEKCGTKRSVQKYFLPTLLGRDSREDGAPRCWAFPRLSLSDVVGPRGHNLTAP